MPKKEKIIYIDDGSTIADMSATPGARQKKNRDSFSASPYASFWEKAGTFLEAMKLMVLPMLFVMGFLGVLFLIVWFLL